MRQSYKSIGLIFALALSACGKGDGESEESSALQPDVVVDAPVLSDANGAVSAQYLVASPYTQMVYASATSRIAGAKVAIPPQAFDIDMEVLIEEGASLASKKTLTAVGLGDASVLAASPAVLFMWTYDEDALHPVTVVLPEPVVTGAEDLTPTLAVLYVKNIAGLDTHTLGVMPASSLISLPGAEGAAGTVRFTTPSFGVFQVVYLSKAPTKVVEVETIDPIGKASEQTTPPGAFTMTSLGTDFIEPTPRLTWDAADFADSYSVHLDLTDATCKQPYKSYTDLTSTSHIIEARDGESFVCVVAKNNKGETAATNTGMMIKVDAAAPAAPSKPTHDGPVTSNVYVTFYWQAVQDVGPAGLSHYEVEVYRVSDNALFFSGPVVDKTSKQVLGHDDESFYARVRAIDKFGNESAWSANSTNIKIDSSP